jgi:hypothetical protein
MTMPLSIYADKIYSNFMTTKLLWNLTLIAVLSAPVYGQVTPTIPVFVDGQAQIVAGFSDPENWVRHDLWVETEFDSDMDQQLDRMHVSVTRPVQTDTEGLKLPVIYVTSPYFAGVAPEVPGSFWDVHQELGQESPAHIDLSSLIHISKSGCLAVISWSTHLHPVPGCLKAPLRLVALTSHWHPKL